MKINPDQIVKKGINIIFIGIVICMFFVVYHLGYENGKGDQKTYNYYIPPTHKDSSAIWNLKALQTTISFASKDGAMVLIKPMKIDLPANIEMFED